MTMNLILLLLSLLPAATALPAQASASDCSRFVKGAPSWMDCNVLENKRGGRIVLQGRAGWAGQPVIDRMRVRLRPGVQSVTIDRGMLAQLNVVGTTGADRIKLGAQAGTISKRFTSKIRLGKDAERDVFTFTNTTAGHGPFNHAQRIVVAEFGREDEIHLDNVGRTIRYGDIQRDGTIPGVPRASIRVERRS